MVDMQVDARREHDRRLRDDWTSISFDRKKSKEARRTHLEEVEGYLRQERLLDDGELLFGAVDVGVEIWRGRLRCWRLLRVEVD